MKHLGMQFVKNEVREWIDAGCATGLFINRKRGNWETVYKRFCGSKVGFTLHCIGYVIGWHTSMIFDPLHSGGFFSHMRSFLWNLWNVDIWWPIKHRIDEWRHPEEHRQRRRIMKAMMQATMEGCADPMPPPPGFSADRFHGSILGERYFRRVAEILENEVQPNGN